jgi:hypothetical protein
MDTASSLSLRQLSRPIRISLAVLLATAAIGYLAAASMAYFEVTSPASTWPDFKVLDRVFFGAREKPVSPIERLLESMEGPMNSGGTMRPAFTTESTGWSTLIENMPADELAALTVQREGERLALVEWVRSGADRTAYEADDYQVSDSTASSANSPHVRIRRIINDRCATCHSENGRNDKARSFPLDTYDNIQPHTVPEPILAPQTPWLIASLLALAPLALLSGAMFWFTSHPRQARVALTALPPAALGVALGCWLSGQPGAFAAQVILSSAALAAAGVTIQMVASLGELLAPEQIQGAKQA